MGEVEAVLFLKSFQAFRALPQFTIAVSQGSAIGMGVALLCTCDLVVSRKTARFTFPEAKMGVTASILPFVATRTGAAKAGRLFCTADQITAEKAKEFGIVDELVGTPEEAKSLIHSCTKLTQCAPGAVAGHKQLLQQYLNEMVITEREIFAAVAFQQNRVQSIEYKEAQAALAAKKPLPWTIS